MSLERSKDVSVKGDDTPLPQDVAAVFESYPADKRTRLLELRGLILDCAQRLFGSASVTESLKWGEPSYRPLPKHGGTTVRLHWKPKFGDQVGLFVHCQTTVISDMRALYGDVLSFDGNRCLWIPARDAYPRDAVEHFVAEAFRYGKR
ncbi:protein of unknown function (DU1801) [Pseudovibrio denitrificans]|uniref:YdhG-like domain-containing protein n=1 Tax=Pseudovibrio denitrificans TaxID=258256 RepID=A0A1I6XX48_9HYPH|nr:DUF1801 domain-containing protein [Pseudovibrio denitrificans]SFT42653.1 protein of unknown function (DU1801) [Pseudovibrio denitrificans]